MRDFLISECLFAWTIPETMSWTIRHSLASAGYGFSPKNILLLTDDDFRNRAPTRAEMFNAFKWLVTGAKAHDSLFFHCELKRARPWTPLFMNSQYPWRFGAWWPGQGSFGKGNW